MPTVILPCGCDSEFHDKLYGKGMRVFNLMVPKTPGDKPCRCTVCERVAQVQKASTEKIKPKKGK